MSCWQHSFVLHWMQSQQSSARKKWGDQTKTTTFTLHLHLLQMWKCVVGWYRIDNIQDFQKSSSARKWRHHKTVILVLNIHVLGIQKWYIQSNVYICLVRKSGDQSKLLYVIWMGCAQQFPWTKESVVSRLQQSF